MRKMEKREKTIWIGLRQGFFMLVLFMGLFSIAPLQAVAAPENAQAPEMTPGPRMIRAVEALADDVLAEKASLALAPDQEETIRKEVTEFKKDIWRKEAVLLGMFEKISLKRRHGLLERGEYQASNQLTGGIESDEMGRMIKAVEAIQGVLTPEQRERFLSIRKPEIHLEHPEGFNTRIGLLALGRIRRAYGPDRARLGLSASQKRALRDLLNAARREIIEIGTQIEISRMEAYDLLKEPVIDPGVVREAMERTAKLEGVFFPKLSEYAKQFEAILTPEQEAALKRPEKRDPHAARLRRGDESRSHAGRAGQSHSILDQAEAMGLSAAEIAQIAELELSAMDQLRQNEVEGKIEQLVLDEQIRSGAAEAAISAQIDRMAQRAAAIEKIRLGKDAAGLKILNGRQKVTFHRPGFERMR